MSHCRPADGLADLRPHRKIRNGYAGYAGARTITTTITDGKTAATDVLEPKITTGNNAARLTAGRPATLHANDYTHDADCAGTPFRAALRTAAVCRRGGSGDETGRCRRGPRRCHGRRRGRERGSAWFFGRLAREPTSGRRAYDFTVRRTRRP